MSAYNAFMEKWNVLAKLLREKPYTPVLDTGWDKAAKDLDKVIRSLTPYYIEPKVPRPADIKAVRGHETTAGIKAFINRDRETKAFFTASYFDSKCAALPDRKLAQALRRGTTKDACLTTFLVYHYWKARPEPQRGLELAHKAIVADYQRSPAFRGAEQARALLGQLLKESDLNRVMVELQNKYPNKDDVGGFAKAVGIKIPAGKKPIHERVAAKILKSGEVVRTSFRGSTGKTS